MAEVRKNTRRSRRNLSIDQSSASLNVSTNDNPTRSSIDTLPTSNSTSPLQQRAGNSSQQQQGSGRRRHRRAGKGGEKHKRKWKPYDKLTWEEKRLLGEKEAITAEKRREEALRKGIPVAPFNTTQFIMEEHNGGKGITPRMVAGRSLTASGCGSANGSGNGSGFCSQQDTPIRDELGDDNDIYFEREYNAALETVRTERLQSLNSQQLRTEVLRLEEEIDNINKRHQSQLEMKDAEIASLCSENIRLRSVISKFADLASSELRADPPSKA